MHRGWVAAGAGVLAFALVSWPLRRALARRRRSVWS
jgi:hypothetical protein